MSDLNDRERTAYTILKQEVDENHMQHPVSKARDLLLLAICRQKFSRDLISTKDLKRALAANATPLSYVNFAEPDSSNEVALTWADGDIWLDWLDYQASPEGWKVWSSEDKSFVTKEEAAKASIENILKARAGSPSRRIV